MSDNLETLVVLDPLLQDGMAKVVQILLKPGQRILAFGKDNEDHSPLLARTLQTQGTLAPTRSTRTPEEGTITTPNGPRVYTLQGAGCAERKGSVLAIGGVSGGYGFPFDSTWISDIQQHFSESTVQYRPTLMYRRK